MKIKLLFAAAMFAVCAASFAQTADPAKVLSDIKAYRKTNTGTKPLQEVKDTVKAMVEEAIKGLDIKKVDPKTAFDWARLYSLVDDHMTTCALAELYLTSNPVPTQQFDARILMMESCNSMGEGKKIGETITATKPMDGGENEEFTDMAVYELADTIAKTEGAKAAYKALSKAEGNLTALSAPDPKDAAAVKKANEENASFHGQFKAKEGELLARAGDKKGGLKLIDDFGKSVDPSSDLGKEIVYFRGNVSAYMSPAPNLTSLKTFGDYKNISDLKGKVVILDFFAHWCGPCRASFPDEGKMYADLKDKGLEIIGVTQFYGYYGRENYPAGDMSKDVEFGHMADFVKKYNLTWPVVIGDDTNFKVFGATAIPHVTIIDRKGIVRDMEVGYDPDEFPAFRAKIEALLKE